MKKDDSDFWLPFMLVGMWGLIIVIACGTAFSIGYDMGKDAVRIEENSNGVD